MKKRTILPIAGLVILSGIAAVSGTFAWFQTDRTATITFTDATVRSKGSNLVIEYVGSDNTMAAGSTAPGVITPVSGNAEIDLAIDTASDAQFITDISGNGVDFYKPNWGHVANPNTAKIDGVSNYKAHEINAIQDADGHYIDFTIKLSRDPLHTGQTSDLQVHLGAGTGIFPATVGKAEDVAAVASSRMSIIDKTTVGADSILFVPVAEPDTFNRTTGPASIHANFDNTPKYIHLVEEAGEFAYGLEDYELIDFDGQIQEGAFLDVPVYAQNSDTLENGFLVNLNHDNEVEVNFRIWIEGTDSDAGELGGADGFKPIAGKIKVVVELYALEVN